MGLQNDDDVVIEDGDGEGKLVPCSICLEIVSDDGHRSWAKLQCGHQFHLDCIGSAFNVKGIMQCPNCRKVEKGQWLYANGYRSHPEFSGDDWAPDEDLYDVSYSEMSFGFHWCPFGQLARLPSAFEEGEFLPTAYNDVLGQHAVFAEHNAVSSVSHPCPYVTYLPVHPSTSSSSASITEGANFNNRWNGPSIPGEVAASYSFPVDTHFHGPNSFPSGGNHIGPADQTSSAPANQRSNRANSDVSRPGSFMHPFVVGHGSGARSGNSASSSLIPPYPGSNARARDRVQALQAYYQQQPSTLPPMRLPIIPGSRRSNNHRGMAHVGPVASPSDQTSSFHTISAGSSGRGFPEQENPVSIRFHAWEREHIPPFSLSQVERDASWAPFLPVPGGQEPGIRSNSFRQRHGSDRIPSNNR